MRKPGFTLVELLIVIAIIAILVALALPNYRESVMKGRRADAQVDLLQFASDAERIFTETGSYITVDDYSDEDPGIVPANSAYYTYTFPVAATATTYIILATPTTVQSKDGCGKMTIRQNGQKAHSGSKTGCWD